MLSALLFRLVIHLYMCVCLPASLPFDEWRNLYTCTYACLPVCLFVSTCVYMWRMDVSLFNILSLSLSLYLSPHPSLSFSSSPFSFAGKAHKGHVKRKLCILLSCFFFLSIIFFYYLIHLSLSLLNLLASLFSLLLILLLAFLPPAKVTNSNKSTQHPI